MAVLLTEHAIERGTYAITVSWSDEDGDPVTPTAATWTLHDREGTTINGRDDVTISGLSTSNTIVLSGADLALPDIRDRYRAVTVEFTYSSLLGTGLPSKQEIGFYIDNLRAVS